MAKFELTKSVEGVKVSKRSGIPTSERITLSFGSIIVDPREERDSLRFEYLGEPVDVKMAEIKGYYKPIGGTVSAPSEPQPAGEPKPVDTRVIRWESINSSIPVVRAKIPGGWLVTAANGLTFVPDPNHEWDGASIA